MDFIVAYGPLIGIILSLLLNIGMGLKLGLPILGRTVADNWQKEHEHDREMEEIKLNALLQQRATEVALQQQATKQLAELATQQVNFLQEVIVGLLKREQVPDKLINEVQNTLKQILEIITRLEDANNR